MNAEARDRNGNEFGSAKWRSPLTLSTSTEILAKRTLFNANVKLVNTQIIALYAERERIRLELEEKASG